MNQTEMIREIHQHTSQIEHHTVQIDALFVMSQEHARDITWIKDNMFTKQEGRKMMDTLDFLVSKFTLLEQEGLAATEWLKRNETRIGRLETHVGLT